MFLVKELNEKNALNASFWRLPRSAMTVHSFDLCGLKKTI